MTRRGLGWLACALLACVIGTTSCGDDDDGTGTAGTAGAGTAGSKATGGSAGVGGAGGTGGTAGSAGSKDAGTDAPTLCGTTACNPNSTNRYCNPSGPNGPRCQACLTDEHCAGNMQNPPRLYCDVAAGNCRACLNDSHCTAPNRCIIGTTNNTCQLRCASDADCVNATNNRHACNLTTMMCVECQTNDHCVGSADGPVCVNSRCEQCGVDTDCTTPGLPACINNNCEACRDNTQCAEPTPVCATSGTNTCRECVTNADCATRPGGAACVTNVCRQCSGSVPCPAGSTCMSNTCVSSPESGPPESGPPESGPPESGPPESGPPESGTDGSVDSGSTIDASGQPEGGEADVTPDVDNG